MQRYSRPLNGLSLHLVEDVLQLMSYRHESEHELDDLAAELSIRYEELNFFYKIGAQVGAIEIHEDSPQHVLKQNKRND